MDTPTSADAGSPGTTPFPIGRIPIISVAPVVDGGRWPAKAYVGEYLPIEATSFREGHDAMGVIVELTAPDGDSTETRMQLADPNFNLWRAVVHVGVPGLWRFRVHAFADEYATWRHNAEIKLPLGVDVDLTLAIGQQLIERAAADRNRTQAARRSLTRVSRALADGTRDPLERLATATTPPIAALFELLPAPTPLHSESPVHTLLVERERAGFGAWYEFFPRSVGARLLKKTNTWRTGTLRTAAQLLPRIADMGFDVVYLPPIHPIGVTNRKGRNNTLVALPGDPGSPWAIGSAAGGHDTVNPELGTAADFRAFVRKARSLDLEVALDLALQASPDHPWVHEHPEWFTRLPDGSIAFAENPPKKYQDIYPINFDNDPEGIRAEVLRIVEHWISQGVTIFRVDNPHTKPAELWEWLIAEVTARHPGTIFLAEAFTLPVPMQTLAKVGFQQSYTYFTWRETATDLADYLTEVSRETSAYFRPNFFVTTPDILTPYLETGGRGVAKVRAAVAATGSPSWGVYSGFELLETAKRPDADEQLDNEKYEFRPRDFAGALAAETSLEGYITALNLIRRSNPALHQLRNVHIHRSDDPAVLVFSKFVLEGAPGDGTPNGIIVVANTAAHSVVETVVHLDLAALGLPDDAVFAADELLTDRRWQWGAHNYIKLSMFDEPVHIVRIDYTGRQVAPTW